MNRRRKVWIAFGLWAAALVAVMGGVTATSELFMATRGAVLPVHAVKAVAGAAASAPAPPPTRGRLILRLVVQWAVVLMAIGASGLLLHGALELGERRGRFVAAVTHELRTPLTTLRMYSEMLENGMIQGEVKQRQYLRTIRLETERLERLVENVLVHARLDGGRPVQPAQPIALGETLRALCCRLEERCAQAGMTLLTEFQHDVDAVFIRFDPLALERILFNLVDNACKYAAESSDRRIHLESRQEQDQLFLSVTDHGPGIPANARTRLFAPFYRGEQTGSGIGLGLSISRHLARQAGGDLRLDAAYGAGCRMILIAYGRLPGGANEFSPPLPTGTPTDPFTSSPLKMAPSPLGIVCYSLGPDRVDDGGAITYDPSNGTLSRGDITLDVPLQRKYPLPARGRAGADAG